VLNHENKRPNSPLPGLYERHLSFFTVGGKLVKGFTSLDRPIG
jgi:hypothetical protein